MTESNEMYRALMELAFDAIFVADAESGLIIEANERAEALMCIPRNQLIGMHQSELHPPEEVEHYKSIFNDHIKSGKAIAEDIFIQRPDGSNVPINISASVIQLGHRQLIQGVFRDISARKAIEEKLAQQELKYRTLFEQAPEAIVLIDPDTQLPLMFNDQLLDLLGYSREEMERLPITSYEANERSEETKRHIQKIIENGSAEFETRMRTKQGEIRDIRVQIKVIEINDKIIFHNIFSDITERKRNEAALILKERQFEILANVGRDVHRSLDVPSLMRSLVSAAVEIVAAKSGAAAIYSDGVMKFREYNQEGSLTDINFDFSSGYGVPGWVIETKETYISDDATTDPHVILEIQKALNFKMLIDTPILSKDGLLLGCFEIHDRLDGEPFDKNDKKVLQLLADTTAIAFENARIMRNSQRTEKKYHDLFEYANDAIYIIDPDRQSILESNEKATQQIGYSSCELLGKPLMLIKADDQQQDVELKFQQILRDGSGVYEQVHQRKDGTIFPVEISSRMVEFDNHVVIQSFVRDITERKEAEKEMNKLLQAIEHAGEAIMITDDKAVIEYVNPAFTKITGYSPEEAVGNNPSLLGSGEQGRDFYRHLWKTIKGGETWRGSLIDRRKDGTLYPALASIAPIKDQSGAITHFVGSQQDMTEYQDLEERFNQAQKMEALGTLVGGIAHDFNNVLAAIMGNAYLAKIRAKELPEIVSKLELIELSSTHAADMVSKLLTFARKGKVSIKPLPLVSFFKEFIKLTEVTIPENIVIDSSFPPQNMTVLGDLTLLQQALMNLLNNAVYAIKGRSDPKIIISLRTVEVDEWFKNKHPNIHANTLALLTVADNGIGIPKSKLGKIFEPFYTTKKAGEGTGLGLAMVFGAIQTHGGVIEVESTVDVRTTFHLYLPIVQEKPDSISSSQVDLAQGGNEGILIVDDEKNLCLTMVEVLQNLGYRVFSASDGYQAQQIFMEHRDEINLALLDMVMPKMSGMELALWLREQTDEIPIIFATGYDRNHMLQSKMNMKKSMIVSKPVEIAELSHVIQKMLHE